MQDPQAVDFDPLYVAATFLDPRYKLLLNSEEIEAAKRIILGDLTRPTDGSSDSEMEEQASDLEEGPQKKTLQASSGSYCQEKGVPQFW